MWSTTQHVKYFLEVPFHYITPQCQLPCLVRPEPGRSYTPNVPELGRSCTQRFSTYSIHKSQHCGAALFAGRAACARTQTRYYDAERRFPAAKCIMHTVIAFDLGTRRALMACPEMRNDVIHYAG